MKEESSSAAACGREAPPACILFVEIGEGFYVQVSEIELLWKLPRLLKKEESF